jgi:hypothetical protein
MKQATCAAGQIPESPLGRIEETGSKLGTVVHQVAANLRLFLAVNPVPSEACLAPKHEGKATLVEGKNGLICAEYKDE